MPKDVVMVFTSKSLETMKKEGGSGNWSARRDRLQHAQWIVAVRNRHSNWSQGDEPHGSAFLIGHVTGVKPSPPSRPNRFVIAFDRYAEIKIENAWGHGRNPVTYTSLSELGINPEQLDWKPFVESESADAIHISSTPSSVVDQARAMIASSFAINPGSVKITIDM